MALTHEQTLSKARLTSVEIGYLKKGDRFVAVRGGRSWEFVSGVADMDGHQVSENYGTRVGSHYYEDPERNYINVKFDGLTYPGERWTHPNDSIYEADGYLFYVTPEVAKRIMADIEYNKNMPSEEEKSRAKKKLELLTQVAKLQKQINEL